jgi:hypothetical protein
MSEMSRRVFGGLVSDGAVTAVAGTANPASAAPAERLFRARASKGSGRPNLLVILGDDLGWASASPTRTRVRRPAPPTRFSLLLGEPG